MWKGYEPWKGFASFGLAWAIGAPFQGGIFRLKFDAQIGTYTVGNTVTGGTYGATAEIIAVQDDGTDGILTLDKITGPFVDNEVVYESALGGEILGNGTFESGGTGGDFDGGSELDDGTNDNFTTWLERTVSGRVEATATSQSGSVAAKMVNTTGGVGADMRLHQDKAVTASKYYKLSFYTRGDGTNQGFYSIYDISNSGYIIVYTLTGVPGTNYVLIEYAFITPVGCVSLRPQLVGCPANGGIIYYDNISLKSITNAALANGMLY